MNQAFSSLIILLLLMLSACQYPQSVTADKLTPKISASNNFYDYKLPGLETLSSWDGPISANIKLNDIKKFSSYNLLSNNISAPPTINNNTLYVLDTKSNLYSFDLINNLPKLQWKLSLLQDGKQYQGGGILYSSGKLYISNGSQYLFIIDAIKGNHIAIKKFREIVKSKPIFKSGIAYVQDIHNNIYAYDTNKNITDWAIRNSSADLINIYTRTMMENQDSLISLASNGLLSKINKEQGREIWQKDLYQFSASKINGTIKDFTNSGVIKDGYIYTSNGNGQLYKVDLKTGNIVFDIDLPNIQNINIIGNLIFIVNSGHQVVAISSSSGKIIWSQNIFQKEIGHIAIIMAPQIFSNQLLIVTNQGLLVILDPITGKNISSININKDASFFATQDGRLLIFAGKYLQISD